MKKFICYLLVLAATLAAGFTHASLSSQIMMVAYDGESWFPYVAELNKQGEVGSQGWTKVAAIENPMSVTRSRSNEFYYKGDDGVIYQLSPNAKKAVALLGENFDDRGHSFAHLRATDNGLNLVQLKDGRSQSTDVMHVNELGKLKRVFKQASSQFAPYARGRHLYYGHVSCRLSCQPVIQDVWVFDTAMGRAKQLTQFNATTYLHSIDREGRYAYLASNAKGYYHIVRLDLSNGEAFWLTGGEATDTYPSITGAGDLIFIRRDIAGTHLMRLPRGKLAEGAIEGKWLEEIPIPKSVQKIRYLEIQ